MNQESHAGQLVACSAYRSACSCPESFGEMKYISKGPLEAQVERTVAPVLLLGLP